MYSGNWSHRLAKMKVGKKPVFVEGRGWLMAWMEKKRNGRRHSRFASLVGNRVARA